MSPRRTVNCLAANLHECQKIGRFIRRIWERSSLRTSNLRPLAMIARAMRRSEDVPRSDQRPATPEFRAFRAVQEYRRHPRPTSGKSLFSADHSILTRVSYSAFYRRKPLLSLFLLVSTYAVRFMLYVC